ncbi:hypothetical protein [Plectonema phage JingP1]|uniref:Uncharacterized protein n=1 Tax=Plectonema phage JingP1 TaxID=2961687 RepID=A0A9E7T4K5_9CAUD|nr:hypothetical protein [Plectonema phage JingP1]UVD33221.1 hypothetical protein [Plectonema phage Pbo-yong3]
MTRQWIYTGDVLADIAWQAKFRVPRPTSIVLTRDDYWELLECPFTVCHPTGEVKIYGLDVTMDLDTKVSYYGYEEKANG